MSTSESSSSKSAEQNGHSACSTAVKLSLGQVPLEEICPLRNPDCENAKRLAVEEHQEIAGKMSAAGALRLPAYLDHQRRKHGIIDAAFNFANVFDRVFVWQLAMHEGETFIPGGSIIQPESYKDADDKEMPFGIIIGAGLCALDEIRSHGMDLGHEVAIIAIAPWRLPIEPGRKSGVLMLKSGDLVGSRELAQNLRDGKCRVVAEKNSEGVRVHKYVDEAGETWDPVMPWISDDT